jgi:Acyl-CoA reductase (LuxC)
MVVVDSLDDSVKRVNVATQTIGVYPYERKSPVADRLASAGGQPVCRVGTATGHVDGSPHDAMYPLARFVHWMGDDDISTADSNSAVAEEFAGAGVPCGLDEHISRSLSPVGISWRR